jgi:hypothetical protein
MATKVNSKCCENCALLHGTTQGDEWFGNDDPLDLIDKAYTWGDNRDRMINEDTRMEAALAYLAEATKAIQWSVKALRKEKDIRTAEQIISFATYINAWVECVGSDIG